MTDTDLAAAMTAFQSCVERRDKEAAERVLHEDFTVTLVHPASAVVNRGAWMDMLEDYVVHEYVIEDDVLDVHAGCAARIHRVAMRATVLGHDRTGTFIISDVWLRADDGWKLWRRHSTPLTSGPMPETQR